jgi:hypothetical protein
MNGLNVQSSVIPNEQISEHDWFIRYNVSTNVPKKQKHLDRHVFDAEKFYDMLNEEPISNFIIKNIFAIFIKSYKQWK